MISSTQFSSSHHSFWLDAFPVLENYVRLINSGGYERIYTELSWTVDPAKSAIASEAAFCLARNESLNIGEAFNEAYSRISRLPGVKHDDFTLNSNDEVAIRALSNRIRSMIKSVAGQSEHIIYEPKFLGCGLIANSFGDVISNGTLIELKSVDRSFRSTDFRQLLLYVLLNFCAQGEIISSIAIINARRGIYFIQDLSDFIDHTSGSNISDIQTKFLAAVGSAGASR